MGLDKELSDFLTELFQEYYEELFRAAFWRTGSEADAADILGEVFYIATFKARLLYQHVNKIAWLYRTLDFCIKKELFRNSRRINVRDENGLTRKETRAVRLSSLDERADDAVYEDELYEGELFGDFLDVLSEDEYRYLFYKYKLELDTEEIARRLGRSYSSITSFGARIRNKIKKIFF